tara:strand:- start:952 stop:1080 length:129 start_codon:yes stop_codon:yes gene_type:complete
MTNGYEACLAVITVCLQVKATAVPAPEKQFSRTMKKQQVVVL